jgi:hypothetical protein
MIAVERTTKERKWTGGQSGIIVLKCSMDNTKEQHVNEIDSLHTDLLETMSNKKHMSVTDYKAIIICKSGVKKYKFFS